MRLATLSRTPWRAQRLISRTFFLLDDRKSLYIRCASMCLKAQTTAKQPGNEWWRNNASVLCSNKIAYQYILFKYTPSTRFIDSSTFHVGLSTTLRRYLDYKYRQKLIQNPPRSQGCYSDCIGFSFLFWRSLPVQNASGAWSRIAGMIMSDRPQKSKFLACVFLELVILHSLIKTTTTVQWISFSFLSLPISRARY